MEFHTELCCVTVTDGTPIEMSMRHVHSWEQSDTSADTPATICSSCTLSWFTLATAHQGKTSALPTHLGLQGHTCCSPGAAQTNAVLQDQMQVHVWVEKQVSVAHVMLYTVPVPEQVHFRQARHPDLTLLSVRTLCRIMALVTEWHRAFGSHIVEACAL